MDTGVGGPEPVDTDILDGDVDVVGERHDAQQVAADALGADVAKVEIPHRAGQVGRVGLGLGVPVDLVGADDAGVGVVAVVLHVDNVHAVDGDVGQVPARPAELDRRRRLAFPHDDVAHRDVGSVRLDRVVVAVVKRVGYTGARVQRRPVRLAEKGTDLLVVALVDVDRIQVPREVDAVERGCVGRHAAQDKRLLRARGAIPTPHPQAIRVGRIVRVARSDVGLVDVLFPREDAVPGGFNGRCCRCKLDGTLDIGAGLQVDPVYGVGEDRVVGTCHIVDAGCEVDDGIGDGAEIGHESGVDDIGLGGVLIRHHIRGGKGAREDQERVVRLHAHHGVAVGEALDVVWSVGVPVLCEIADGIVGAAGIAVAVEAVLELDRESVARVTVGDVDIYAALAIIGHLEIQIGRPDDDVLCGTGVTCPRDLDHGICAVKKRCPGHGDPDVGLDGNGITGVGY